MAHHKRRRPKNSRSGCLFCKPHKANGNQDAFRHQLPQEQKARISEREQRREV
jgi:hypothetical protein